MILLRLLKPQGMAGIALSLALAILLVIAKRETRHWKKQSSQFEQLYRGEQSAFATTVANYRAAADAARALDKANAERVAFEQRAINERTVHDLKLALPMLALSNCASKQQAAQAIPAIAQIRQCPAYPMPPAALLRPPAKLDFLTPTR